MRRGRRHGGDIWRGGSLSFRWSDPPGGDYEPTEPARRDDWASGTGGERTLVERRTGAPPPIPCPRRRRTDRPASAWRMAWNPLPDEAPAITPVERPDRSAVVGDRITGIIEATTEAISAAIDEIVAGWDSSADESEADAAFEVDSAGAHDDGVPPIPDSAEQWVDDELDRLRVRRRRRQLYALRRRPTPRRTAHTDANR